MKIVLTGYDDGKKMQAIKGIRAATNFGVSEAKDLADRIENGEYPEIDVPDSFLRYLGTHGVVFHEKTVAVPLSDLIAALARYPRSLRVGDLHDVLSVTAKELA